MCVAGAGISSYLQSMFDPAAAKACEAAGVGATVKLSLGAHTDHLHGSPLDVKAKVPICTFILYKRISAIYICMYKVATIYVYIYQLCNQCCATQLNESFVFAAHLAVPCSII